MLRLINEQQSPAVAVPENFREEWKRNVMIMWACVRNHDSSIPSDVLHFMRESMLKMLECYPSPRITEQGAREIIECWVSDNSGLQESVNDLAWAEFINGNGRALLAKLNFKSAMIPSDDLINEMAKNVADNLIAEFCLVDLSGCVDISDYINCKSVAQSMRKALNKRNEVNNEKAN